MIVAISGLSGCGKNTVGEKTASMLGLKPIRMSFKDEAARRGIPLMELQAIAGSDGGALDRELDARISAEAARGDCVVTTWLGPWSVKNADLRVWLNATLEERARRVAGRDGMKPSEAKKHVRARDRDNVVRYKKYYGIDIRDHSMFDLEINTNRFGPDQSAVMIAKAAELVGARKFEMG